MSFSNGNGPGTASAGPYVLTLGDVPLNPLPDLWAGMTSPGSL